MELLHTVLEFIELFLKFQHLRVYVTLQRRTRLLSFIFSLSLVCRVSSRSCRLLSLSLSFCRLFKTPCFLLLLCFHLKHGPKDQSMCVIAVQQRANDGHRSKGAGVIVGPLSHFHSGPAQLLDLSDSVRSLKLLSPQRLEMEGNGVGERVGAIWERSDSLRECAKTALRVIAAFPTLVATVNALHGCFRETHKGVVAFVIITPRFSLNEVVDLFKTQHQRIRGPDHPAVSVFIPSLVLDKDFGVRVLA
mmetsp:Transcript_40803/g.108120  ORF Transcript_40803/g.108120 Transcript_40803/m.108120 type:complete len:248 (+) Transcript_40803:177-920(+)